MRRNSQQQSSAKDCKSSSPRTVWGHGSNVIVITGILVFLLTSHGAQDAVNGKPAKDETVAALRSQGQPEQTSPFQPDRAVRIASNSDMQASFILGSPQAGVGRCDGYYVCHYSLSLAGAAYYAAQTVEQSEAVGPGDRATALFDPVCAAKDLNAITYIEQLGTADDVSSDRLAKAGSMLMIARANCAQGRITEALEQYENLLADTLASDRGDRSDGDRPRSSMPR